MVFATGNPAALGSTYSLSQRVGAGLDPCAALQATLAEFRDARAWGPFHTAEGIARAVAVEAGELNALAISPRERRPASVSCAEPVTNVTLMLARPVGRVALLGADLPGAVATCLVFGAVSAGCGCAVTFFAILKPRVAGRSRVACGAASAVVPQSPESWQIKSSLDVAAAEGPSCANAAVDESRNAAKMSFFMVALLSVSVGDGNIYAPKSQLW